MIIVDASNVDFTFKVIVQSLLTTLPLSMFQMPLPLYHYINWSKSNIDLTLHCSMFRRGENLRWFLTSVASRWILMTIGRPWWSRLTVAIPDCHHHYHQLLFSILLVIFKPPSVIILMFFSIIFIITMHLPSLSSSSCLSRRLVLVDTR